MAKRVLPFLLFTILSIFCVLPLMYLSIFRFVDQGICYTRINRTIGVGDSYEEIIEYITNSVKPGMDRSEVEAILQEIGPLEIERGEQTPGYNYIVADTIWIKRCFHPMNNFFLIMQYSIDGKLIDIKIPFDDV